MFKRFMRVLALLGFALTVGGCSTAFKGQKLLAIERCNAGAGRIYDVRIEGRMLLSASKEMIGHKRACGSSDSSYMEVPDSVDVSWRTADGVIHRETVTIKARVDKRFHLRRLIFNFDEGSLQVQQFLSFDEPWALGRDVVLPIYP
ncbi:MAG: hypothetical protein ACOZE7_14490 [Pseudomonadota bacterium]